MLKIKESIKYFVICTFSFFSISISSCSDLENYKSTQLYTALFNGNLPAVKEAIENGADIKYAKWEYWPIGINPLQYAVQQRMVEITAYLLEIGSDANFKGVLGETLLMYIAGNWNPEIELAQLLLDHGARINEKNIYGETALDMAAKNRSDVFEMLVSRGAEIGPDTFNKALWRSMSFTEKKLILEKTIASGYRANISPLLEAVYLNDIAKVKELVKKGVNINEEDYMQGNTPLITASALGYLEIVMVLAAHGAQINRDNKQEIYPLLAASYYGRVDVVKYLMEKGAIMRENQFSLFVSPVNAAIINNQPGTTKFLLEHGAHITPIGVPDANYYDLMKNVARAGNTEIIKILITHGIPFSGSIIWALFEGAILGNKEEVLQLLFEKGIDMNLNIPEYGNWGSLFVTACSTSSLNIINYLVNHGADINFKIANHQTPLYWATEYHRYEIVEYLLKHGAKVNDKSFEKDNAMIALQEAAKRGNIRIVKLLFDYGGDIKYLGKDGRSALLYAALNGHEKVIEYLIQKGSDINLQDNDGNTALILAAEYYNLYAVQALLKYKADTTIKNKAGSTALDAAKKNKCKLVIEELEGQEKIIK